MATVNPPPIRVPKPWEANPEMRAYGTQLHTFLRQLWELVAPVEGVTFDDSPIASSIAHPDGARIAALTQEVEGLRVAIATLTAQNARLAAQLNERVIPTNPTAQLEALRRRIDEVEILCL